MGQRQWVTVKVTRKGLTYDISDIRLQMEAKFFGKNIIDD